MALLVDNFLRLSKIKIKGFKEIDKEVAIEFSKTPVTIIFGENGSGKTTLLRIIQAALKEDSQVLQKENVQEIEIEIETERESYGRRIVNKKYVKKDNSYVETSTKIRVRKQSSILFGTNRGLNSTNSIFFEDIHDRLTLLSSKKNSLTKDSQEILDSLIEDTSYQDISDEEYLSNHHLSIDNLRVDTIEKALKVSFDKGQKAVLKGMSNAFFSTIDNALNLTEEVILPENFQEELKSRKDFFLSFIQNLDESKTKKRIQDLLERDDFDLKNENPVFRALLVNLLNQSIQDEQENLDLKAINTIVETFNEFVIAGKKLIINSVEAFIQFPDGSRHELKDLSSGERHLLSLLTLFLILGRNRRLFLIDEPEISMSIKWQRKLLDLLSEFSPQAQIIVATHSPSIADGHTEYLKELV